MFGFEARTDFKEGLRRTINWYTDITSVTIDEARGGTSALGYLTIRRGVPQTRPEATPPVQPAADRT
jgi:hypothetical protein